MTITIRRELRQIKNGVSSTSLAPRLAAHGYSQEVADLNLQRTVCLFLAPYQREGTLQSELDAMGLQATDDGNDKLRVVLEE